MADVKIDITPLKKLASSLDSIEDRFMELLKAKVEDYTPVSAMGDGGKLKEGWVTTKSSTERTLENSVPYAAPVELGHKTRLGQGKGPPHGTIDFVPPVGMLGRTLIESAASFAQAIAEVAP